MKRSVITKLLIKHEGVKLNVYRDTVGKLTIGCGRNLDDHGISEDEALLMLDNDITRLWHALTAKFPFFGGLDDTRQHVLLDMAYNLGVDGVGHFTKVVSAIETGNYNAAADEMLESKWAKQVGTRAQELAAMMRHGAYTTTE
jgi:lysozyme